jgi:hypothetical protein
VIQLTNRKLIKINDEKLCRRLSGAERRSENQEALILEVRDRLRENNNLVSIGNSLATKIADILGLEWFLQLSSDLKSLMERIYAMNVATYRTVVDMQSNLSSHLEKALIQEPFLLEDAIGRISPEHMSFISSWEAFDAVLELRFRGVQGYSKVRNGKYILQEHATQREIRRSRPWEVSFLPGQRIDMAMILKTGLRRSHHRPLTPDAELLLRNSRTPT